VGFSCLFFVFYFCFFCSLPSVAIVPCREAIFITSRARAPVIAAAVERSTIALAVAVSTAVQRFLAVLCGLDVGIIWISRIVIAPIIPRRVVAGIADPIFGALILTLPLAATGDTRDGALDLYLDDRRRREARVHTRVALAAAAHMRRRGHEVRWLCEQHFLVLEGAPRAATRCMIFPVTICAHFIQYSCHVAACAEEDLSVFFILPHLVAAPECLDLRHCPCDEKTGADVALLVLWCAATTDVGAAMRAVKAQRLPEVVSLNEPAHLLLRG
jgi:hypothetical protein